MTEVKPRSVNCLFCQKPLQFDATSRSVETDVERSVDTESYSGKSVNLINVICNADIPANAPICRDCSDVLMNDIDKQLAARDQECLAYKKLLDDLKSKFSKNSIASQKETLRNLRNEEKALEEELKQLEKEEQELETQHQLLKQDYKGESEGAAQCWRAFRDKQRHLLDISESSQRIDAELRYIERQHNRLASTNVLDLAFHIWVDVEAGGTIPEINGHRLGRLPERENQVEWLELNAAFGQVVLLLDILMQRANVKQDFYKLVAQGSHSGIKVKKPSGETTLLPLYGSGSWKPFGNNNVDGGITALLGCFELLCQTLQSQDSNFRLQYKIVKDRLVHQNVEYSAKMLLNREERWTKAMKMFLCNLKSTQVQAFRLMRSGDKRIKRSRSASSDSENEDGLMLRRRRGADVFRRFRLGTNTDTLPSSSLLTFTLLAALGVSSSLFPSDLSKMYGENDNSFDTMDVPMAFKPRPQRLRYRDDLSMMKYINNKHNQEWYDYSNQEPMMVMPLVTERQRPTQLQQLMSPTTSAHSSNQEPSLEDIELIDVLWRSDAAAEEGYPQIPPPEQSDRDLQLLTVKGTLNPWEEQNFEDIAKGYFEDFPHFGNNCKGGTVQYQREVKTPTNEDLDALWEDMNKDGGQLDQLCPNNQSSILNNVSLSQGIIFDSSNVTELQTYEVPACSPPIPEGELFSNGTMDSPTWPQQRNLGPSDIFPVGPQEAVFPMFPQNETSVPIISTGVHYNHSYTNQAASNSDLYDSSFYVPNGMSSYNESSSVCSSSTTSHSPSYLSEAENMPPSRYYGKLAPNLTEDLKEAKVSEEDNSNGPRRRGRQSKDEQLAKMNGLPLSAKEIAEMSLADLQKMLKSESLTEQQKALIKKIRRRGKNKVAARTCRQRRGDRLAKATKDHWENVATNELESDE